MPDVSPTPETPEPQEGEVRLDSWKEIANYLGREVRTVQGWEKSEGLPVHRHRHARQGSVYAFRSELDTWKRSRRISAETAQPAPEIGLVPAAPGRGLRRAWILAAMGALAITALVLWMKTGASPLLRSGMEPLHGVPLTSAPGQELEPALSPEGNQVAYSWNGSNQDNFDIYVKLIGAGPPLRLTTSPAKDSSPAWSRDGSSIAFLRETPEGRAQVIVIPSLGGPERIVGEVYAWPMPWRAFPGPHLTWTPDGKGLIVSDRKAPREPFSLYYLSLDGSQFRRLTDPPLYASGDTSPAFSPDGRSLAFRRSAGFASGTLYVLRVDQRLEPRGAPDLLIRDGISPASPAWTPDGRALVYSDGYYIEPGLKLLTLGWPGSGARRTYGLGVEGSMFVTTALHSSRLVYATASFDPNVWEVRIGEGTNTGPKSLISSTRIDSGAQYSPDGRRIAFLSGRSGNAEIWTCDRDGADAVQLTSFGDAAAPRWSPDGKEIVFLARSNGQEKIYVIRSGGGQPRQLTTGLGRDHVPSWSRDGRFVYFRSSRSGEDQVWKVPREGGAETQVTRAGGELALEGPDGTLYYSKTAGDAWSIWKRSADGLETEVLPSVYPMTNFTVTDDSIYFTPHPQAAGGTVVQRMRFTGGKVETVATVTKPIWFGLSVAPDEKSILYSQIDHEEGNLMLVERWK